MNTNIELYKKKYLKYKAKYLNIQRGGVFNDGINHPEYKIGKVLIPRLKPFSFLRNIGNTQDKKDINKLFSPALMAFDNSGNIVLADTGNKIVKIIDPVDGHMIRTIGAIGTSVYGAPPGKLYSPIGVAFFDADHIIVSDRMNPDTSQLVVFKYSDGLHVRTFAIRTNSDETDQSLCYADSIAVSKDGYVFALDGYDFRIKIFNFHTGIFMRSICSKGNLPGQIGGGGGNIVFDNNGNIVVADYQNKRIQIINSSSNVVIKLFNTNGYPSNIIVDSNNNIIVTLTVNVIENEKVIERNCIMVYNMNGDILIENYFGFGNKDGEIMNPSGIAINTEGNIFVIDNGFRGRIQIFE